MGLMKWLKRLALAGALMVPSLGQGQTSFYTDRAVGVFPINSVQTLTPMPYGQVRVCTLPTAGSPCNTPATITNISGSPMPIVGGNFGQITTDIVGRFSFGCTPGNYQIQVAAGFSNIPQLNYPITCPIVGGTAFDGIYARLDGTNQPFTAPIAATIINATTGFRLNGLAPTGNVLRGNGTNFVAAQLAFADLANSLACAQMPALTGDVTSAGGTCATTLPNIVTAGTNTKITFNAKGQITGGAQAQLASADFANQGTTTTVLHGAAAGNPSFGAVSLATDVTGSLPLLSVTPPTGTGYAHVTSSAWDAAAKLINLTAAADVAANQGTTTTVLHGNAAGQASFAAVNVGTDITGVTPVLNGGTGSSTAIGAPFFTKWATTDHVVYVTPTGNDSNDGLSPGSAKLTVQAAFNTATTSGANTGVVNVGCGTYTGPTTWYSNLAVLGVGAGDPDTIASFGGSPNNSVPCVKFTYAATFSWTQIQNTKVSHIVFDFNNGGGGLVLSSTVADDFDRVTLNLCGNSTTPCLVLQTVGSTGPAQNNMFNTFNHLRVVANTSGSANSAIGIKFIGAGPVNAGAFSTNNRFFNTIISGGLVAAIDFELNADSNYFYDTFCNQDVTTANSACIVFNANTPASDQDADGEILESTCPTGFTNFIRAGASSGNSISRVCSGGSTLPSTVVLGGTVAFQELSTVTLPGASPFKQFTGVFGVGANNNIGPPSGAVSGDIYTYRNATQGAIFLGDDNTQIFRNGSQISFLDTSGNPLPVLNLAVNGGVKSSSGKKHQRIAAGTTPAGVGSVFGPVTLTWTAAFADALYTPNCGAVVTSGQAFTMITAKVAASVSVVLVNMNAAAATASEFDCMAEHD